MLPDIPDERETIQTIQGWMEDKILKLLDVDESYYWSKYKEPGVSFTKRH